MRWGLVGVAAMALSVACGACGGSSHSGGDPSDPPTTFGADASSGGSSSGDPGTSSSSSSGGSSSSSSGSSGDGSAPTGCSGSAADPAAAATISGYIDTLPFQKPSGQARADIIDAIIKACVVFGPTTKEPAYQQKYCWAQLAGSIEAESSYDATSKVTDSYGTRSTAAGKANDPTVGLLQIR